jgi:PAS domain S-box-containing protein
LTMAYPSKAKWSVRPAASVALRYGLALISVAIAQGLAHMFLHFHLPQPLTAFALCAIAITFRYGGTDPGILAALLAALLRSYAFEPEVNAVARILYDLVFLVFTTLMIRFTRERKELEARVAERTAELTRTNEDLKLEIAERKHAEAVVKQAEGSLRRVLDTTPALIHSARPDGYLDYFNQRWLDYVGLSPEGLLGWAWTTVIHPEDLKGVVQKWRASLANGRPFVYEARLRRADGEYRWQLLRRVPLRDIHGNIVKWYGSAIDIEDRMRAEEELRQLSGRLLRLQDEERRRIARDLHDSAGQDLVALATMLGQLHRESSSSERKSRGLLSECKVLANRCIREIRTLSYVLHPPMLDEAGLEDAIRDYVTGFTRRSGIQVELELSPRLGRMTRDVELALFRVVQEALTNIQRHSGSQQAKIRIDRNSRLTLEISDLGHGLSAKAQRGEDEPRFQVGVGIPSMQERVKLIGGRLEIDSTSQGTTVRVTISLEKNEREEAAHSGG